MINEIVSLVKEHETWRGQQSLNLIPSENVMSPAARSLLSSDLGQRYTSRDKFYMGTRLLDEIELQGEELAKKVFKAETADLRPLSGHIADFIVLASLTKPDDTVMCVSSDDGGYPGIWRHGLPDFLRLRLVSFPFSKQQMNIDAEKAEQAILDVKPRIVIFGASLFLFPHPIMKLAKAAHDVDAHVGYDGSHVLGLIAGRAFQDPLKEGASMLFGSTHKTLFGPQGGIILADERHGAIIKPRITPAFVDNAHWNRIAALTLALAEMKEFGTRYASQVVRNAQALAKALSEARFPVAGSKSGFTKSHQVFLDYGDYSKGRIVAKRLEKANIIADCGVRLGVCELTRRGMKEKQMQQAAELIKRVVKDKERPEKVQREVVKFMSEFQTVKFCFE
jgi:glycine hydroxymethyltransferase